MDNKILIRPTECIEYLGIAQSSFYRYIKLGLLAPDGYGKRNQPLFFQETMDEFCQKYEVEPGKIQSQGKSPILRKPKKPQSQGRSAFIDRADRPKEDEAHPTGAIIHWSERFKGGSNYFYIPVTCTTCENKFDKLDQHLIVGLKDGSFTGCCQKCYRHSKRKSQLRGDGSHLTRDGYIMRHRLTFTPEEWEIIGPMCTNRMGYILEHRAIVALAVGRPLASNEPVHHKNGVKNDNSLENLEILTRNDHSKYHAEILHLLYELKGLPQTIQELQSEIQTLKAKVALLECLYEVA